MQLHDGRRIFRGDFFDVDTALGRQHEQMLLGRAVERERRVVLLGDVGCPFDPHALHDVALDAHADDVSGVRAHLVFVVGQLDAARLAATADLHLRFHDDWIADALCDRERLVDGVCDVARRHRNAELGEVLLA